MRVDVERGVPDLYLDGAPELAAMDAAFCRAFGVPSPGLFDGAAGGTGWLDAMSRQAVGLCHRLGRAAFATKLDLFLPAPRDVMPPLRAFSALLHCPLALDVGAHTADDRALLITPDGRVVHGLLEMIGPGREEGVPEVAFRPEVAG